MKKTGIAFCIAAAFLFLVNASIWEGAASAAGGGDLPESGYFAATNSFPRNTVVDVTNLENGCTIRVIVAQGLDTPGLLVILSKDAADAINLPTRSIGRVRMNQPADPVAFSRNTESIIVSSDPDHNPEALIAAEGGINPDLFAEAETGVEPSTGAEGNTAKIAALIPVEPIDKEPKENLEVSNAPEYSDDGIIPEPGPALVWTYSEDPETPVTEPESPQAKNTAPEIIAPLAIVPETDIAEEVPQGASQELPASALNPEAYDFAVIPAEERIPPETSIIDPADMVAQIGPTTPVSEHGYPVDPYYVIDPAREIPPAPAEIPTQPIQPDYVYTPHSPGENFSVPVIASLEKGKYYLQVAAVSKPENVETEINKIGRAWPMAVQSAGSTDKPVYRILIGPVNLGESGALLQRFKTNYKDAFVRQGS